MNRYATKFAVLGLMGAIFAIPAASQADGLRINLPGFHLAIGTAHRAPVVVVDIYDWQWRRDHGYSDWAWYRDHPECRIDKVVWLRDHARDADRGHDRDRHDRR